MKIKICGLTTLEDVEYVNRSGVDFAGFVLTPHRLAIDLETAKRLKAALDPNIKAVGVFINESEEAIRKFVDAGIIDMVQFHGDVEYNMPCPAIRAFRMRTADDIKPTDCDFVLFDSFRAGEHGSTGDTFDWSLLDGYRTSEEQKPFFLAGGINIGNIREALKLDPYCIDISSGVEENGKKSFKKIMEAVNECKKRKV
ncbi:MAG: phosphoribosylanthranilate isomerase [Methanomassiliicoccaceae archaeon]|nr:phosphoribosylanthranilate isomerase [Methanomassiliicoccaceae archaeon]